MFFCETFKLLSIQAYKVFPFHIIHPYILIHSLSYFRCVDCGRSFGLAKTLETHIRTHTGEKPYECDFCLRRFATLNVMTRHQRLHLGLRPYSCPHCPKTFSRLDHRNRHQSIHRDKMQAEKQITGSELNESGALVEISDSVQISQMVESSNTEKITGISENENVKVKVRKMLQGKGAEVGKNVDVEIKENKRN